MVKIDMRGTINPDFNPVEFDGIGMHANVQQLQGAQS
jgi:hypothetical protein